MIEAWNTADPRSRRNLLFLIAFFAVLSLFGGASRMDELGQPVVRIAASLLILSSGLQLSRNELRQVRVPLVFLLCAAAIAVIQLIPLPADLWASMPGRALYASALERVQLPIGSRPLSLTPDLTLNALLALLPPLAAILTMPLISRQVQPVIVALLLVVVAVSSFLAVLQISSGAPYLYRIANFDSGVGLFANRNHQALFLATAFPLLAAWVAFVLSNRRPARVSLWVAVCFAALLFPLLLVTGSRAGLLLGLVAAALAAGIVAGPLRATQRRLLDGRPRWLLWLPVLLALAVVAVFAFFARDAALQRLFHASQDSDLRARVLPVLIKMIRDFLPFGSGLGSFDAVYRAYEPLETLSPEYMNQAHDDLAQIVLEGGVPAALLVLAFLGWVVARALKAWRGAPTGRAHLLGRTAAAIMLLILLSCLVDYPLRTPMFATIFAVAACWLGFAPAGIPSHVGGGAAGLAAPRSYDRGAGQSGVAVPESFGNV
jgi:O-antigen ligase